ncbi:MAG: hypothetical protein II878_03655 [Bacteroidales bacterium]|nr:hypothetical protein [Bacteroidales bacterium]
MKKIITLVAILFATSLIVRADGTPTPNQNPSGDYDKPTYDNDHAGPVGTATALLVTLGAGAVAYKVRKNKKEE